MKEEVVNELLEIVEVLRLGNAFNLVEEVFHVLTGVNTSSFIVIISPGISELDEVPVEGDWVVELSTLDGASQSGNVCKRLQGC